MTTEYRFCLTPRLIALGIFSGITLMLLLFALGYLVGERMSPKRAPGALDRAADKAQRNGMQKLDKAGAALVAPITAPAKAVQKAMP